MRYTRGRRTTHCPYCGAAYATDAGWPRDCPECEETNWSNPLPVAVVLQPVITSAESRGLIVVRRDIEPGKGRLALPGGYMETGETWKQTAVRELREETGLKANAESARLFGAHSTADTLDLFALLPERDVATLPDSVATAEVTEWLVLDGPADLAFPAHTAIMNAYFLAAAHATAASERTGVHE